VRANAWLELLEDSFDLARTCVLGLVRAVATLEERAWASSRPTCAIGPVATCRTRRPLDAVEQVALLTRTFPLCGTGVQPLTDLAALSEEIEVPEGGYLFTRAASPQRVFALFEGRVEAGRRAPDACWSGGPGQIVCGTVAFGPTAHAWEARALAPTRALAFELDDWLDVMEENFEMVRATLASLALEHERLAGAP
jgi:CRP-like cAMP-binding protein